MIVASVVLSVPSAKRRIAGLFTRPSARAGGRP